MNSERARSIDSSSTRARPRLRQRDEIGDALDDARISELARVTEAVRHLDLGAGPRGGERLAAAERHLAIVGVVDDEERRGELLGERGRVELGQLEREARDEAAAQGALGLLRRDRSGGGSRARSRARRSAARRTRSGARASPCRGCRGRAAWRAIAWNGSSRTSPRRRPSSARSRPAQGRTPAASRRARRRARRRDRRATTRCPRSTRGRARRTRRRARRARGADRRGRRAARRARSSRARAPRAAPRRSSTRRRGPRATRPRSDGRGRGRRARRRGAARGACGT